MIETISKLFIYPEVNAVLIGAFILLIFFTILIVNHRRKTRDEDG